MLCTIIRGPSFLEARNQLLRSLKKCRCFEMRADLLTVSDAELQKLILLAPISVLTWKKPPSCTPQAWVKKIQSLAKLHPTYLDLDKDFPEEEILHIRHLHPNIKIIRSLHTSEHTDITQLYTQMLASSIDYYKLAVSPASTTDLLNICRQKHSLPQNTTVLCLGKIGQSSRILSYFTKSLYLHNPYRG